jgi:hypothetical protein
MLGKVSDKTSGIFHECEGHRQADSNMQDAGIE